jgi:peptide/nickel transport system permease protein
VVAAFAAATFAFVCLQLAPGDPATALGEGVPEIVRERARAMYGYNDPVLLQYGRWLSAVVSGDFGYSTSQRRPALDVVLDAIPNSLAIVLPGLLLAFVIGSAVGTWQGIRAGSRRDQLLSALVFLLYALPEFVVALALLVLFSVVWPLFPSGGVVDDMHAYLSPTAKVADRLRHLVLPCLVVALFGAVTLMRFQRQSMRDSIEQPFVRTALANGLPLRRVYLGAWRASLLPVLTMLSVLLPFAVLGLVFVEQVFAWPGLGLALFNAINARDYNVVAACVVAQGLITGASTVVVDLLREAADPRLTEATIDTSAQLAVRS